MPGDSEDVFQHLLQSPEVFDGLPDEAQAPCHGSSNKSSTGSG
jgi:hypothetical protein